MNKKLLAVMFLSGMVSVNAFAATKVVKHHRMSHDSTLNNINGVYPVDTGKALCKYEPKAGKVARQMITCNFWADGDGDAIKGDSYHALKSMVYFPAGTDNYLDHSVVRLVDVSANSVKGKRDLVFDEINYGGDKDGSFKLELSEGHTKTSKSNQAAPNSDIDITFSGDNSSFMFPVGKMDHEVEDHDSGAHNGKVADLAIVKQVHIVSEKGRKAHSTNLYADDNGFVHKGTKSD